MDKAAINQIVDQMIKMHTFSYSFWSDAKKTVEIGNYSHCFDALSLCEYESNLSVSEKSLLRSVLSHQIAEKYNRQHQQTRREYEAIFYFLVSLNSPYKEYEISKTIRPDFVLHGKTKIGLEVVEFTTETQSILRNIASKNFGYGKTPGEIRTAAVSKHGSKADWYRYTETNGHSMIAPRKLSDCNLDRYEYASKILQKWKKYRTIAPSYDMFILLCDARGTIAVTDVFDTHSIMQCLESMDTSINHFTICIMYEGKDSYLHVGTYDL